MSGENGELTQPVYWEGEQWAATGYGIEGLGRKSYYNIGVSQLRMCDRNGISTWPDHMAEKRNIDRADFNRALLEAIKAHKIALPAKGMAALEMLVKMKPANDNLK